LFDWGLKGLIAELAAIRSRNCIHSGSKLRILVADGDLYVAVIDEKVIVKLGPRLDVSNLIPSSFHGVAHGDNYCVWEKSPNS
jgi:alpha-amylase